METRIFYAKDKGPMKWQGIEVQKGMWFAMFFCFLLRHAYYSCLCSVLNLSKFTLYLILEGFFKFRNLGVQGFCACSPIVCISFFSVLQFFVVP